MEKEGGGKLKTERLNLDREKEKDSNFNLGLRGDLNWEIE